MNAELVAFIRAGQRMALIIEPATESTFVLTGWHLNPDGTDVPGSRLVTIDRSAIVRRTALELNPTTGYLEAS